ncbi:BQ5605_C034g11297 [Microbotryum silenes-dioicae]|uniref:BQ5605_C034g11297 protein n=1 Tax=Microbotryum silenes-dioicae TaxID=796604 RepID=A0A2X0PGZ8_9BASI|nr:BQ5605_C034g11297 [Microbotryum silenes-dioicae]
MERLLGAIPSYQPCKHEAECLKKTSSLRIRVVEPVLGMIIAGLVAEEQASESSTKPRWGDGKFSLISKSPRLHRHQQGDEELLLLADRRVTSVVCLESKQDPVLNKYGRVLDSSSLKFPKAAFRLADQEATRLRVKKPATFKSSAILLKRPELAQSGLQLATASIDYQLDVRFGIVCGAYLGFVTEKGEHAVPTPCAQQIELRTDRAGFHSASVRLPELHKGDFGVLFSPIFQSLPTTSFETHYPTVSLAMVLLALCLSDVLEVEEPSPDVVAALFKDAQFEAEDDTTDSSFRSGSDTEGSLYMDTEAPSSDSN